MASVELPVEASRAAEVFLTTVDEAAPGLVTGFYLVGSVALGDFHPRGTGFGQFSTASDIDFVAVTDRRPEPRSPEMAGLAKAHARTVARFPRPHLDGAVFTWPDLAAGPDDCPDVPYVRPGGFGPAGRFGINPVTFCELAWHGITVRGPKPADTDLWADRDALRAYSIDNLATYWRPMCQQSQQRGPVALAIGVSAWFPAWVVLGVSRLHHLLAAGTMTSKCGAGRYARETLDARWQPIIDESLALRTSGAEGRRRYRNPLARRRDTIAFLDTTIEAALALPANS